LEYFKIPYTKHYANLSAVKTISPTGFVPVLRVPALSPEIYINDSLAICEFLAESHPDQPLWPKDRILRALARSAVAEMHSGFSVMRNTYDTNFVAKYTGKVPITEEGRKDVERMLRLWGDARARTVKRLAELGERDEGFLFGGFGIADAFFWPVLWVCSLRGWDILECSSRILGLTMHVATPHLQSSSRYSKPRSDCLDGEDVERACHESYGQGLLPSG
jgi:glutathione S-transferase